MTITDVATVAYYALAVGFAVATWRRNPRWRDAWWCAFGMFSIEVIEAIVAPGTDIPSRISVALAIGVWLWVIVRNWRRSGIPCRIRGHSWLLSAKGPNGVLTVPVTPDNEARLMESLAPRLLGQQWTDAAIVTKVCSRCNATPTYTEKR